MRKASILEIGLLIQWRFALESGLHGWKEHSGRSVRPSRSPVRTFEAQMMNNHVSSCRNMGYCRRLWEWSLVETVNAGVGVSRPAIAKVDLGRT